ncbi:MAG: HAD family hydrolase [Acidobacteria bacterium]|nr:HAD family hydrolase [Acidobacteriota bacterium]
MSPSPLDVYRHVIWDWNGTLLDDAWLCVAIMNDCLRRRGLAPITHQHYMEVFRFPVREYYLALGFDFTRESFSVSGTEFIEEYERRKYECRLQAQAENVLAFMAQRGLSQSILSAYRHETLQSFVAHYGLRPFFSNLLGAEDHYADGKRDNGLRLIRELDVAPQEVVYVGDTAHDFDVAREIGVDCVLIPSGHSTRAKLEACGVPVLDSLGALLNGVPFHP